MVYLQKVRNFIQRRPRAAKVNPEAGVESKEVLKKIFTVNLGARRDETVLVFTDIVSGQEAGGSAQAARREDLRRIAKETAAAGEEFCTTIYHEFPSVAGHGMEPPEELWAVAFGNAAVEKLKGANLLEKIISKQATGEQMAEAERVIKGSGVCPDGVVALSNYSTSHTRFRDLLTRCMGSRYASMPLFDAPMLTGAMSADWKKVEARTNHLVDRMSGGDMVYVTSHNGTSVSFSMKGRDVLPDTGILTEPGSFGNLPAGEAFLAPVEGTAEGTMILEYAPTGKLGHPIELTIAKGRAVKVSGSGPFADDLRRRIADNPLVGNIAELGIGTNDRASRPDNILETEKILGTVHIALGDNSSFGGKVSVPFHEDFIFFKPTLEVFKDGAKREIIIEGKPHF